MSLKEGRRSARIELGGVEQVKERVRKKRLGNALHSLMSDIRFGFRQLCKNPSFTAVAVLVIALGIGANTALFSVIDAVLLKRLPFHEPGRLVAVRSVDAKDATMGGNISYPDFLDWRAQSRSFEAMSVWTLTSFTYTDGSQAETVPGAVLSGNLFSMLGISPIAGRTFTPEDDQPGAQDLPVILSFEFWQSHFGSDPSVLGRALTLDSQKYNVAGVMPPHFQYPVQAERVDLWTTIARDLQGKQSRASQRGVSYLFVTARLRPGFQIAQAQSDLAVIQERLNHPYPESRPRAIAMELESEST